MDGEGEDGRVVQCGGVFKVGGALPMQTILALGLPVNFSDCLQLRYIIIMIISALANLSLPLVF